MTEVPLDKALSHSIEPEEFGGVVIVPGLQEKNVLLGQQVGVSFTPPDLFLGSQRVDMKSNRRTYRLTLHDDMEALMSFYEVSRQ